MVLTANIPALPFLSTEIFGSLLVLTFLPVSLVVLSVVLLSVLLVLLLGVTLVLLFVLLVVLPIITSVEFSAVTFWV
ncbi:hypothetical protein Abm4_1096 [Methanobrevibacter sp. AbM4]|nr:hypothetical protein Abm4_1096 [Methanobrevibacter sp. AbM4]